MQLFALGFRFLDGRDAARDDLHSTRERPWAARDGLSVDCHRRSSDASAGSGPEPHRHPHRNRQGRTGRRPCGCARHDQFTGADRWPIILRKPTTARLRFPALPPGVYMLDVVFEGLRPYHEAGITIGAGAIIEVPVELTLPKVEEAVVVDGSGSRIDSGGSGVVTRFRTEDIDAIPMRRSGSLRLGQGGAGDLADITGRRSPRPSPPSARGWIRISFSSTARASRDRQWRRASRSGHRLHPGAADPVRGRIDRIRQRPGRRVDVITKSGSNRFLYDAAYFWQPPALTSQPMRIAYLDPTGNWTAATNVRCTATSRPASADRSLAIGCGSSPDTSVSAMPTASPAPIRRFRGVYEQDKMFAKLTWHLAPGWRLVQSFHDEFWSDPERRRRTSRATRRRPSRRPVPAINFGHLTHTFSANTLWDLRVGAVRFTRGHRPTVRRSDRFPTSSNCPTTPGLAALSKSARSGSFATTAKVTLSHYRAAWLGADHEWRIGAQVDRGEHRAVSILPTGVSYAYTKGVLSRTTFQPPTNSGGRFVTAAAFVSDALRVGDRVTINPGIRFDHSRAISQDVPEFDALVQETGRSSKAGARWAPGTSSRRELTAPSSSTARAARYCGLMRGDSVKGMLTGELSAVHPGRTRNTIRSWPRVYRRSARRSQSTATGSRARPPSTDQYSSWSGSRRSADSS